MAGISVDWRYLGILHSWGKTLRWWIAFILLLVFILLPFILWGDWIENYAASFLAQQNGWGAGLFVVGALALDVFLPIPSSLVGTLAGAMFGTVFGAVVIWLGLSLGCGLAYAAGRKLGAPALDKIVGKDAREKAGGIVARRAVVFLTLFRVVPVLAEASVLSASALDLSLRRFMTITTIANAPVAVVYALFGSWAVDTGVFWPSFGAVGVTLIIYLAMITFIQRSTQSKENPNGR